MTTASITRHDFEGAGLKIAADIAGNPADPAVIFMHGGGQTRSSWGKAVLEVSRAGFYAVSLDLRGHGDSGWSEKLDYSIDFMVADLRAVIDKIGKPVFLVGASLGGVTSLVHAGEGGKDLMGLVLVDVAPRIEFKGASKIGAFMRAKPEGFESIDEAADAVAAYLPHRPRPKDTSGLMKNLRLREGRYHWHWDPNYVSRNFTSGDLAIQSDRLEAAARNLTIPALLVRGGLSEVVSPESVEEFRALAPHAEVVSVEGADHMVAGDRNDKFNDAVIDFLNRKRPA